MGEKLANPLRARLKTDSFVVVKLDLKMTKVDEPHLKALGFKSC